jgi:fumarylpyruvate hydrolase
MSLVVAPPATITVPVEGGAAFPVRRIYCVGRNYAAHAREMGHDPERDEPFFFTKPADAIVLTGAEIPYPPMSRDVHHEVELVVAIGRPGFEVSPDEAQALVFGYATGIDLTRRDLQANAKKAGRPWDMGKAFDFSAPCGVIRPAADTGALHSGGISLAVNGKVRQHSDLAELIWSVPEIIAHLSRYVTLAPGDLIYTGTPDGVGPVEPGDEMHARIEGLADLLIRIAPRA